MKGQELQQIDTLLHKAFKFIEESTTFKEQLQCFLCCYVLLQPHCTLSSIFMFWLHYFSFTIMTIFLRDDLNISPIGWKEKCTLKKLGIVLAGIIVEKFGYEIDEFLSDFRHIVYLKAPCLLGLYDLVVAPADSDTLNEVCQDEDCVREDALKSEMEDLIKAAAQLRLALDLQTATACDLKRLVDESRVVKAELAMRNYSLSKKLSASKLECDQLRDLRHKASESIQRKLEEENKIEKTELNNTIQELESSTRFLQAMISVESDRFETDVTKYKTVHKITEIKLKETREDLEAEKNKNHEMVESIEEHKAENEELKKDLMEMELERDEIDSKLYGAVLTIEQLQEVNDSLELEKDLVIMNLQKANESIEFYKKLLEYDIV